MGKSVREYAATFMQGKCGILLSIKKLTAEAETSSVIVWRMAFCNH